MRYLPDTNVWIQHLKRANSPVSQRLMQTPAREIAVCSIVWGEMLYGARKYELRTSREKLVVKTLSPYKFLSFGKAAARQFAIIRDQLERRGEVIGPYDLQIAAIAIAHDLTVVTNNVGEFGRVDGLKVEDWSVV